MRYIVIFCILIAMQLCASASDINWKKIHFPKDTSKIIALDQIGDIVNRMGLFAVTAQNLVFYNCIGVNILITEKD